VFRDLALSSATITEDLGQASAVHAAVWSILTMTWYCMLCELEALTVPMVGC